MENDLTPMGVYALAVRSLPVALARCFVQTKAREQHRLAMLNRHYGQLSQLEQLQCRAAILELRDMRAPITAAERAAERDHYSARLLG